MIYNLKYMQVTCIYLGQEINMHDAGILFIKVSMPFFVLKGDI